MINTWKCDMCHEKRDDEYISVLTYPLENFSGGERNLKYCNDRFTCYNKALEKSRTGEI